ncbi:MAG TPA: hypothetical protein VJB94_04990 [Candidatus Nanoarchaeia archaeon]|nr:hypothetical protein [Candidatus Nanoarchaeia archaeon]
MGIINSVLDGTYRVALFPKPNEKLLTKKGRDLRDAILNGTKSYSDYESICLGKLEEFLNLGEIYGKSSFFTMNSLKEDTKAVEHEGKDDFYFIYTGKKA